MKKCNLLILRATAMFCLLLLACYARGMGQDVGSPKLCGTYLFSEGGDNYKCFVVSAEKPGSYYCNFWLQPAEKSDGSLTEYKVRVNDVPAGTIVPVVGGAQQAAVDGTPTIVLNAGTNVITVSTRSPEVPDVETLRLSAYADDAQIPTLGYEAYMEKALQGDAAPTSNCAQIATYMSILPLKYSFYRLFSFTEGQEVSFKTSSKTPHAIDLFIFASTPLSASVGGSLAGGSSLGGLVIGKDFPLTDPSVPYNKGLYILPTNNEMQGLSWKRNSEPSLSNPDNHEALMKVKIPKAGKYMLKLRSADNNVLGVCDLTMNGSYRYNNVPIYYYGVSEQIPADGDAYLVYAAGVNPESDDPMLFVQGNAADRIVGYNDDAPSDVLQEWSLGKHDSYFCQVYKVKASGVHVCNYSSSNPESSCFIDVWNKAELAAAQNAVSAQRSFVSAKSPTERMGLSGRVQECSATKQLPVSSDVKSIQVFSLSGTRVASFSSERCHSGVSVSDFSGKKGEAYIIVSETGHGLVTQKIIVK